MIGVIPAAGKGTRLKELGKQIPKTLIKIKGQTLLERAIENLKEVGIKKILVIVGYQKEKVIDFLNSKNFNVEIQIVEQKEQKGLAHAILQCEPFINEPFLVHLGDTYVEKNYNYLIDQFKKYNSDFMITYEKKYGTIQKASLKVEDNKIITLFQGEDVKKGYLGCGLYLLKPIFFEYCKKITKDLKDGEELSDIQIILELIKDQKNVMAFEAQGKILNITTELDVETNKL